MIKKEKGISLVEVIIALAILVVGILGALKVFPLGLMSVQHSRDISIASRLGQQEIEEWKNSKGSLPEAIIASHKDPAQPGASGGYIVDYVYDYTLAGGEEKGDLTPDELNVKDNKLRRYVNPSLEMIKHIVGETVTVSGPIDADGDGTLDYSLSPLSFGQVEDTQDQRVCYPEPYQQVASAANDGNDYGHFAVSGNQLLFDITGTDRWFSVNYSFVDATNQIVDVVGEEIFVPGGNNAATLAHTPIPSSLLVRRQVVDCNNPNIRNIWSIDPVKGFLYFYADPGILYKDANGVIGIKPSRGEPEPAKVKVDYRVRNWETISTTQNIKTNGLVKLPLNYLDTKADLDPQTAGVQWILAVDARTGQFIPPLAIDDKRGELYFDPLLAGTTVRVLYRTKDKWAVQAQKAAADYGVYYQYYDINSGTWPWNGFSVPSPQWCSAVPAPDPNDPSVLVTQLGFQPTEAGKTVIIDYLADPDNDPSTPTDLDPNTLAPPPVKVTGELAQIPARPPYIIILGNPERSPTKVGKLLAFDANGRAAIRVRGVSVKARVIWDEKGKKRRVDTDTSL